MNIKKVLDEVLSRYYKSGGTFKKEVVRYGVHVFTHVTKFACVKQPPGGKKDAYYALHHMRALVRDQQQLTLPSHLKLWDERLSEIQDADLRQEFYRIQSDLAGIISEDVLRSTGEFHLNNQLSNNEIDSMLRLQADGDRPFMTITNTTTLSMLRPVCGVKSLGSHAPSYVVLDYRRESSCVVYTFMICMYVCLISLNSRHSTYTYSRCYLLLGPCMNCVLLMCVAFLFLWYLILLYMYDIGYI